MTGHPNKLWTPEEDDIVRANPTLTKFKLAELLPGRSPWSCAARRTALRHLAEREGISPPVAVKIRAEDYAGMSLTARLMGDPPLSRSGLAQKQQGGPQHG
jgi:hypothetical protein